MNTDLSMTSKRALTLNASAVSFYYHNYVGIKKNFVKSFDESICTVPYQTLVHASRFRISKYNKEITKKLKI